MGTKASRTLHVPQKLKKILSHCHLLFWFEGPTPVASSFKQDNNAWWPQGWHDELIIFTEHLAWHLPRQKAILVFVKWNALREWCEREHIVGWKYISVCSSVSQGESVSSWQSHRAGHSQANMPSKSPWLGCQHKSKYTSRCCTTLWHSPLCPLLQTGLEPTKPLLLPTSSSEDLLQLVPHKWTFLLLLYLHCPCLGFSSCHHLIPPPVTASYSPLGS